MKFLIVKQILLVSFYENVWRTVWRICNLLRVLRVKTKDVTMVTNVLDSPRGFLCELPRILRVEFPKGI